MKNHKHSSAGFTLIEVAIVIAIGSLMIVAAAFMLKNYLMASRVALSQNRMQDIDNAISQYLAVNGVLPCPALLNDAPGAATFGKSITDGQPAGTDCYNQSGAGTFKTTSSQPSVPANNKIVIGSVPVATLGLPDTAIADAWGDRFVYAVTDYLTMANKYNPALGVIGLEDGGNNPIVGSTLNPPDYAQYVILSYGADRAGAYTLAGALTGTACPAVPALENTNCALPTQMFRKTMQISTRAGNNYFDDYVIYHSQLNSNSNLLSETPSGMVAPFAGMAVCPPGWQTYTGTASSCTAPAAGLCCQRQ